MIIAHLPAGYLLVRALEHKRLGSVVLIAVLIGGVVPDLDMLWFYLVDDRGRHHHLYLTHRPMLWVALGVIGWAARRAWVWGLALGALLHMALDTPLGAINWLWPLGTWGGPFLVVPATQSHFLLSFILHWTFAAEIVITALAGWLLVRSYRREGAPWRGY